MGKWIQAGFLKDEVGPGVRFTETTAGSVRPNRFLKVSGDDVVEAGTDDTELYGVSQSTATVLSGASVLVAASGKVTVEADVGISKGDYVKCGYAGVAVPVLSVSKSATAIKSIVGGNFGNQPANDGVEIVSDSALDVQTLRVWGTTNGGVTVVKEDIVLTGTTPVSTVKTDWGVILGVEIIAGGLAIGTITIREASGNATITTIAAGAAGKGVARVTGNAGRAFNRIVQAAANGASTKYVGIVGVEDAGDEVYAAAQLTGATLVDVGSSMLKSVTRFLVGDVESARTVSVRTNEIPDDPNLTVGRALETAVAGDSVEIHLAPLGITGTTYWPCYWLKFVYDFDDQGGAVSTITLTDQNGDRAQLPANACIISAHYEVVGALTSGGAATLALGYTGAANAFKTATAFDDASYAVDTFDAANNSVPAKVTAAKDVIATIAGAALTAGVVHVTVQYIVGS